MDFETRRLIWAIIVVCVIAYGIYLFWGSVITAADTERLKEITAYHRTENNSHVLSGMLMIPTCRKLSFNAQSVGAREHHISFVTFEERTDCDTSLEPRAFTIRIPVTSPDERFTASVDGERVPFKIVRQ